MGDFDGKVVIVTGGAKGIGRGITLAFAGEGAHVFCADVDVTAGEAIEKDGELLAGTVTFVRADVSTSDVCRALVDQAVTEAGGLDIICNNVGIQPADSYMPADEFPEEIWDRIINVNLKSNFLMAKYGVPELKKRGGGVIINTASVQGLQAAMGVPAYAASKGGQLSLTRQLALDYAEYNIRVLAVCPGTIDTPLLDDVVASMDIDKATLHKQLAAAHPLGRIGKPEDIANAYLFLASEKASFMTGEYICVDGGMMAKGAWV